MLSCVELAQKAVEQYVKKGKMIDPPAGTPPDLLDKRAGVFVTIKQDEKLRGCMGTYLATQENTALEIIRNAVAAAARDARFPPVSKEELPELKYVVSILEDLEEVEDISQLDPEKYGVFVRSGLRSGLLLPNLKGVDTASEQFSLACRKAGLDPQAKGIEMFRFKTKKYE